MTRIRETAHIGNPPRREAAIKGRLFVSEQTPRTFHKVTSAGPMYPFTADPTRQVTGYYDHGQFLLSVNVPPFPPLPTATIIHCM
ncbi:hypothetical protein J6590_056480 [Homalodisca vitripennis]|nr:hypothetical protein J6590_056480 [Homalodisca vitripennis]